MGTGSSGFLRLYSEAFLALWLPYPPLDEQSAISEFVGRESGRLDEMRAATERTLALLKERRSALIAAAVTGQIDVENVA
jgi:type I restriction enzyme S subunit